MKRYVAMSALVGLIAASACVGAPAVSATPVILISIDTLRADHLSAYGYASIRTPNIDAFGDGGTVFERIESAMPMTLPSHTVMLTSTHPYENLVQHNAAVVPAGIVTLPSVLRTQGYRTAAFVGSMILARRTGFDQGFDVYDTPPGLAPGQAPDALFTGMRRDAATVANATVAWLNQHAAEPLFALVHFYDLHSPYTPPIATGFEPALPAYDLELAYVDQVIGRFRAALEQDGLWDRSLVIVTSDHGESLGDHGEPGHGHLVYDSTVHVPLIVHWPRGQSHPRRVSEPAGLIDLAPTILSVLGIAVPKAFKGDTLLSPRTRTIYGESPLPSSPGVTPFRFLVSGSLKYIEGSTAEMFDLVKDPHERVNLLPARVSDAAPLKTHLAAIAASAPVRHGGAPTVSDSTREMLRSLGYTAGGTQGPGGNDGRAAAMKLRDAESIEAASTLIAATQYGEAARLLKRVLTRDPQNKEARRKLATACAFVPSLPDCK